MYFLKIAEYQTLILKNEKNIPLSMVFEDDQKFFPLFFQKSKT